MQCDGLRGGGAILNDGKLSVKKEKKNLIKSLQKI